MTPWTIACQAPLPMRFPRQEYWIELPFTSPKLLPNAEIEPEAPELAGRFPTPEPPVKHHDAYT